jgi:hypothetical protein
MRIRSKIFEIAIGKIMREIKTKLGAHFAVPHKEQKIKLEHGLVVAGHSNGQHFQKFLDVF